VYAQKQAYLSLLLFTGNVSRYTPEEAQALADTINSDISPT